jgi:hypothetical protein
MGEEQYYKRIKKADEPCPLSHSLGGALKDFSSVLLQGLDIDPQCRVELHGKYMESKLLATDPGRRGQRQSHNTTSK